MDIEPRRILPNLIVPETPEAAPLPSSVAEGVAPRRPRGRPRKVHIEQIEPSTDVDEVTVADPATTTHDDRLPAATEPRGRLPRPASALAPGERWKRRLSRWAR